MIWNSILIGSIALFANEKQFPERDIQQWKTFLEWEIKNPSHSGNPFDVEAYVIFKHRASKASLRTPMFFDTESTWKFRFTGTLLGEWSFETKSIDEELNGWTGQVTVLENPNANAHGFITSFGNKWGWQGMDEAFVPQYPLGDGQHRGWLPGIARRFKTISQY